MNNGTVLERQNDSLALLILQNRTEFATSTNWSGLLEALGSARPAGLFYERFGCEGVAGRQDLLQLSISGSAQTDLSITQLLQELSRQPFISKGTVLKLERSATNQTMVTFTLLCNYQL